MLPSLREPPRHAVGAYLEWAAPGDLVHVVDAAWDHAPVATPGRHRVVPDDCVSLALVRGPGPGAGWRVLGPVRSPRWYAPGPGEGMTAVRLYPEWAGPLLGLRAGELVDVIAPVDDVAPALARTLERTAEPGGTAPDVVAALLEELRRRLAAQPRRRSPDALTRALRALRGAAPDARLDQVARHAALSPRHLRRRVGAATGLGPKTILRTHRLHALLRRADRVAAPAWSRLALAAGWADQAHMARDVRALTGAPPTRLHAERRAEPPRG